MSIKTKLILVIASVIMVVGLATGFIIYWQNNLKLTEHANADIKNTINYTSQLVNFYFGRVETNVNNLARDPLILEALTTKDPKKVQQVSDKMTTIVDASKIMETMALMSVNGSTCTNVTASKASLSIVGKDFSDRDYCKGIIKTKAPYLSSVYIGAVTKHPNLAMVVPVKNSKGEMIGFISGVIDISELRGYLWDLQKDSSVVLLDRYGTPFLDTTKIIDRLDSPLLGVVNEVRKELADNINEAYLRYQANFVGYKFNGSITVIYMESAGKLLAFTSIINLTIILAIVAAILLTTVVVYFFVGTITGRISRISQVAGQIAGGQFGIKLDEKDLKGTDEIGVLARAFNDMATKLADLYKGLEERVKQRTLELDEKNTKLQESETELKKILETSEKANKLMVGRELEMVKLKKRIIELEELKKV